MLDVTQKPMLARLVRELPARDVLYEPKWDGFAASPTATAAPAAGRRG